MHLLAAGVKDNVGPAEASRHRLYMVIGILAFVKTWGWLLLGDELTMSVGFEEVKRNWVRLMQKDLKTEI